MGIQRVSSGLTSNGRQGHKKKKFNMHLNLLTLSSADTSYLAALNVVPGLEVGWQADVDGLTAPALMHSTS